MAGVAPAFSASNYPYLFRRQAGLHAHLISSKSLTQPILALLRLHTLTYFIITASALHWWYAKWSEWRVTLPLCLVPKTSASLLGYILFGPPCETRTRYAIVTGLHDKLIQQW